MFGVQAYAYTAEINGIYYNLSKSDKIATVTYYVYTNYNWLGYQYQSDIIIPSTITYEDETYEVTGIGFYAFACCSGIKSITIPNSVTTIGGKAFEDCTALTNISIGNSVTKIEYEAFKNCKSLNNISIPNSVTSIGSSAFENCYSLNSINIPNSVTNIGSSAFKGCTSLTYIPVPSSVTSINQNTFSGCLNLKSITIPNSITSIGEKAFSNCNNLESFTFGTGVVNIDNTIFYGHTPCKVIWLTKNPPYGYEKVQGSINYVINEQYSKIDNKIILPNLSSIFESEGIKYVPISPSERTCEAIDCIYDKTIDNLTIGSKTIFKGIEMIIKSIRPYVFYGNKYLKNIKWEYGGIIPKSAFQGCINLFSIEIADNTNSIGDYAFAGCSSLKEIKYGDGILTIGNYAFSDCKSLDNICIPKKVARILDYSFKGCTKSNRIIFEEPKTTDNLHRITFDDCTFQKYLSSSKRYEFDVLAGDILTFDYSYKEGNGSGGGLWITLNGSKILEIERDIKSYYIHTFDKPEHVILNISFSLSLWDNNGASVTNIEVGNDYSITLGSNGSTSLFSDCPLDSVIIGRNIKYRISPFYNNKSLSSVFITNKETKILDNEFYGCAKLKNISIGEEIESIGNKAFSGCISLEKYICGSKVKTIGQEAFADCTAIKKFICRAVIPPTCGTQALEDINKWDCTLSVPQESTTAYQQANQWKDFFFIDNNITKINSMTNELVKPTHIYDLNGKKLKEPNKGINIIGRKKVVVK